jgi:hypothetical protein
MYNKTSQNVKTPENITFAISDGSSLSDNNKPVNINNSKSVKKKSNI